jgi:hypothetical protein
LDATVAFGLLTTSLNREEERGKMRRADRDKELDRQRIRRRGLVDKVEKPVQAKDGEDQPQQIPRNHRHYFHALSPFDLARSRATSRILPEDVG